MRLRCFFMPSVTGPEPKWWPDLTGTMPKNRSSRLQESLLGRNLILSVRPDCADWLLTAAEQEPVASRTANSWFPHSRRRKPAGLMRQWFPVSPAVRRLVLGTVLTRVVKDRR